MKTQSKKIFNKIDMISLKKDDYVLSGNVQNQGLYKCCNCGQKVYLDLKSKLPNCPRCNSNKFEVLQ